MDRQGVSGLTKGGVEPSHSTVQKTHSHWMAGDTWAESLETVLLKRQLSDEVKLRNSLSELGLKSPYHNSIVELRMWHCDKLLPSP